MTIAPRVSVRLRLIIDDIELGTALTRLAALYFQSGDVSEGIQTRLEAEKCHTRAERYLANLCPPDHTAAVAAIKLLRSSIDHLSTTKCCKLSDLTADDMEHAVPNRG